MTFDEQLKLKARVSNVFRPGTPVDHQRLFAGRLTQVNDVLNATLQPGRHVVLFGERGVGKTSLARIIAEVVSNVGHTLLDCHTINCQSTDDFTSLWRNIFREVTFVDRAKTAGFGGEKANNEPVARIPLESLLPDRQLQPDDIRYMLSKLDTPSLIIIDEVDKLERAAVAAQLAETIKTLSDHAVRATLILIGVADSVEDLIEEHQSIERALVQVPLQRMSREELVQIIRTGLIESGLTADDGVETWIPTLSQGLPHYTHSLSLYAAYHAIEDDRTHIEVTDVLAATKTTVEKSHTIRNAYHKAINSPQKKNLYARVLRACALVKTDELGYFRAGALSALLTNIMGKHYTVSDFRRHLLDFCRIRRGPILTKVGEPRSIRYRFIDPMMQPFVIIHDYSIDRLTNELLNKAKGRMAE